MKSIWKDIQKNYTSGTNFIKLLYINVGVFLIYSVLLSVSLLFSKDINQMVNFLEFPASIIKFIKKPWTILSYMFFHVQFFHLLFNMIGLHFGSKLFLQYFNGKQLLSVYILGGISGGIFYMLCFNNLPAFTNNIDDSVLLGASASVYSIIIAICCYIPNYRVPLLIGNIQLKYIAILLIIIALVNIGFDAGNLSHLGGAIFGFLYVYLLRKGMDISVNFYNLIGCFSISKRNKLRKTHKRSQKSNKDIFLSKKADKQKKINIILEKISKSGYESLSKEEKEMLFKESKK